MHSYYNSHNKQYRKEISGLCSVIRSELEELFSLDSDSVVREIQDVFETKLLLDMPYVGGKKNSNDTSNLISCCKFAAFFVVGKRYGIAEDEIGRLIHTAWQRKHKKVSPGISRLLNHLLEKKFIHRFLKSFAAKSERYSKEYDYAWKFEYAEPNEEYSVIINCTRCGAYRYLKEKGLEKIMPYVCNIDFETAAAYGVPYYRNETIACGDVCCANLVKRNAPVIMDNYPPHCLRGDGLK